MVHGKQDEGKVSSDPQTPNTKVNNLLKVFEKSPVTPPEELHERENKKQKQKK